MPLQRHEKQAAVGASGLLLATSGNRIVDSTNRQFPKFGRGMEAAGRKQMDQARSMPRAKPRGGQTWAEVGQQRRGGPEARRGKGPMRRAANQLRAQEMKQAQGTINRGRRVGNFRLGFNSRVAVVGTGLVTGVPASLAAVRGGAKERDKINKRSARQTTDQALIGGAGGAATYYGAMYGSKPVMDGRINRKTKSKSKTDPTILRRQKEILAQHRERTGVSGAAQGDGRWKAFHREYPKDLPGAKWKRASSHLFAGKRGLGVLAGTAATGGAINVQRNGRKMQGSSGRGSKQVSKGLLDLRRRRGSQARPTYYYQDQSTSPVRAGGVAAGAGLIALGAPRARMIGAMSAAGQRSDLVRPNVKQALARGDRGRARMVRGTQPAVNLIHRTKGVGGLVDLVPARLRPYAAAGAGAALIQRSVPVRRTTYRPVQGDPMYGGW